VNIFEEADARSEGDIPREPTDITTVRCKCGNLVYLSFPTVCDGCKEANGYWKMMDGKVIHIKHMKLDHLTNCIKMLAEKAEKLPPEHRGKHEIALDIMYLELGSRDKEIAQASGILGALRRSLDAK
jgi:hypothetical protein